MTCRPRRTVVVLQPGYLPWLGFFDQVRRSDVFVFYDDVQFDKHGWRNRNRIKAPDRIQWLTVPVLHKGRWGQKILDVPINTEIPWARKHVATIRQCYSGAPFLERYIEELDELLSRPWTRLVDLDVELVRLMCGWLGIQADLLRSSALKIHGERVDRLVRICVELGATHYLSGDSARSYLDPAPFARHGIDVEFQDYDHPTYAQQHGPFVPNLSALDLLLNCGDESASILSRGRGE